MDSEKEEAAKRYKARNNFPSVAGFIVSKLTSPYPGKKTAVPFDEQQGPC